ncbi:MAG TPA: DUF4139 domain-containing protein, partial [Gemmataceae bacterium]|nr:DUF4139 domain-containing protein [Gemmataceae bacterium]
MKQRRWLWFGIFLLGAVALGTAAYTFIAGLTHADTNLVGKDVKPGTLPIKQVVLFNSGLGYFQREGDVDGNARVELSFPVGDINDLLKSLVLQDAKGRIGAVTYDSNDPIEKILRSFALDLTGNPTFGQILNQARGEKVEITRGDKKNAGTIIGMEIQRRLPPSPSGRGVGGEGRDQLVDVEILNLNTAAGIQAIPLDQVSSVRFQNPVLENE